MKNPIAFLLGAGASFPYGVPMMLGFYKEFREYLERRHPHCFAFLQELEKRAHHETPDLETLLDDLQSIMTMEKGLALIGSDRTPVAHDIDAARELRGYLDAFIVDRCERFDRDKCHRELEALLTLRRQGPLWVFTTNYDRTVEWACDQHGISWCDGFEVKSPQPVANWLNTFDTEVRIVKLHGSVNWYEDDPGGGLHRLDRGYSLPAHDFRLLRGSQQLRPLMIIPTLEKHALGKPYVGLAIKFTDVLNEVKLLVIAGNSLRDRHIKGYIQERLGSLRVLLVSPSAVLNRSVLGQPDRTHAVNAGFSEFLTLGGSGLTALSEKLAATPNDESCGKAIDDFINALAHDVQDEKSIQADSEISRLWTDLRSETASVRIQATKTLKKHQHPVVIRRLKTLLGTDPSDHVRVTAIDSLTSLAGIEAVDSLGATLLADKAPDVQMEAALALVSLHGTGTQTARDWLKRGLTREGIAIALRTVLEDALK